MSDNECNRNKGNESENKDAQDQRKQKLLEDITSVDIFGAESPNEPDKVISESGKFTLWLNEDNNIYVEKRDDSKISQHYLNYLKRIKNTPGIQNVFREDDNLIEICLKRWVIAHKQDTGREENDIGHPEDLLPIVAEAI